MTAGRPISSLGRHLRNLRSLVFTAVVCALCYDAGQVAQCSGGAMTTALRSLSTGELLDRTFSLYRSHFGLFVGIFALPYLVVLAYQGLGLVFQSGTPQFSNVLMSAVWSLGALFLILVVSAASQAATVVAVSNLHLDRPSSVMDSFSSVRGQILGVVGLSTIVALAAGIACLALIVPGVLLFIMWSLAVPTKVLEHKGIFDSMSRSMELTKGS